MTDDKKKPDRYRRLTFSESLRSSDLAEGRRAPRHQVSRITSCRLIRLPEPLAMDAQLKDISTTGIGIYAPAWLDPGTFLSIKVEGWLGNDRTLRAKVVHATRIDKGRWLLGCSLDAPLTWQELEDLL